jgi:hypothetical protein
LKTKDIREIVHKIARWTLQNGTMRGNRCQIGTGEQRTCQQAGQVRFGSSRSRRVAEHRIDGNLKNEKPRVPQLFAAFKECGF